MTAKPVTYRCRACGYRSDNPDFFREAGRRFVWRLSVCEACEPPPPSARRARTYIVATLWLFVAMNALVISFWSSAFEGSEFVAVIAGMVIGWPIGVAMHESGHALAARALGLGVPVVTIGRGEVFRSFKLGRTRVDLRLKLWQGGRTLPFGVDDNPGRLVQAAYVLGGPVANGIIAAGVFWLSSRLAAFGGGVAASAVFGLGLAQAAMAVGNLYPFRTTEQMSSDGLLLWRLAFKWRPSDLLAQAPIRTLVFLRARLFDRAVELAVRTAKQAPQDPGAASLAIHCISRADGDSAAVDWALAHAASLADGPDRDADVPTAWLRANIAWSALKAERFDLSETIEAYSRAALDAAPDRPEMQGTRGAVLVWRGDAAAGVPMLLAAVRRTDDRRDKADFCGFLASALASARDESRSADFKRAGERFRIAAALA